MDGVQFDGVERRGAKFRELEPAGEKGTFQTVGESERSREWSAEYRQKSDGVRRARFFAVSFSK